MNDHVPSDTMCRVFVDLLDEDVRGGVTPEDAREILLEMDAEDQDEAHRALFVEWGHGLTFAQAANAVMRMYWFDKLAPMLLIQQSDPGMRALNSMMAMAFRNGWRSGREAGYMAGAVNAAINPKEEAP